MNEKIVSLHDRIKREILLSCNSLGYLAYEEYRGDDWRADVFVECNGQKYAFEVQTSQQSFNRTKERQAKFLRDGIIGCWLFEKEKKRPDKELENLPLFHVTEDNGQYLVSLKGRKILPLETFVQDFLQNRIKFCHTRKALPIIDVRFLEMPCWKCKAMNHIYYIRPLHSACNTVVYHQEAMWSSEKLAFRSDIVDKIKGFARTDEGRHISLSTIKDRYSHTVGDSYMSFGCHKCDSIFGDWYVHEAIIDSWYDDDDINTVTIKLDNDIDIREEIPHWCHPGENDFCD